MKASTIGGEHRRVDMSGPRWNVQEPEPVGESLRTKKSEFEIR